MKKIFLIFLVLLITGCSSTSEVKNPNGSSLTYKYFSQENYQGSKYNLRLKNDNSVLVAIKDGDNFYYNISGGFNLTIIEKNGYRYQFDMINKIYNAESIITKENYMEGILPADMKKLKKQNYQTGKEKITGHKYTFETYKYDKGKTTYYFDDKKLKYIKKQTKEENLLYEVLSFSLKVKSKDFDIPKGYTEITY